MYSQYSVLCNIEIAIVCRRFDNSFENIIIYFQIAIITAMGIGIENNCRQHVMGWRTENYIFSLRVYNNNI